jgi:hypothetical protein
MSRLSIAYFSILMLGGCSVVPTVNVERVDRIEARIVAACEHSGLFKGIGGVALAAVPLGVLPKSVLDAGVDRVCANPERYARYADTVAWVLRNLRDMHD